MIKRYAFQRSRHESGRSFLAERLAGALSYDRIAGYFKTLLLRRIGSSMEAGRSTVAKMLGEWDRLGSDYDSDEYDDDEDSGVANAAGANGGPPQDIRTLTPEELDLLDSCLNALNATQEEDPKWRVILGYLKDRGWADEGCILFSQYFDTASWIASGLAREFPDRPVAVYAGSGKSGIYENGTFMRKHREEIKGLVKQGILGLVVGTDAASEGLNLQRLGTLINIDLPWNPTRLEQRKGRIQRIGQKRESVKVLNLRYRDSVEDKVHTALAGRLEEIFKMFGQIPDVLEDLWVDLALDSKADAEKRIGELSLKHPFDERYGRVEQVSGWEDCARVVNRLDKLEKLRVKW